MPYIVLLHTIFISTWVGSLLLLCSLCAERTATDQIDHDRLNVLTLRLFAWGATLAAVLAVLTGVWLAYERNFDGGWLPVKLGFVVVLASLHVYIGRLVALLRDGMPKRRGYYLLTGSAPMAVSLPILYLVLDKPF